MPVVPDRIGRCNFITGDIHFDCIPLYFAYLIQLVFSFLGLICLAMIMWAGYKWISPVMKLHRPMRSGTTGMLAWALAVRGRRSRKRKRRTGLTMSQKAVGSDCRNRGIGM
jgi:hypothetical protein